MIDYCKNLFKRFVGRVNVPAVNAAETAQAERAAEEAAANAQANIAANPGLREATAEVRDAQTRYQRFVARMQEAGRKLRAAVGINPVAGIGGAFAAVQEEIASR